MATKTPSDPKIFHITHVDNLASIVSAGCLWSDDQRGQRSVANVNIGHLHIKQRRLSRRVPVAARGTLGQYVPFYFCPRSVMLYAIYRGHPDYAGGQADVVHLVSRVSRVTSLRGWAFTDRHAELGYALYYDDLAELHQVDWSVMPLRYWANDNDIKEKRQAEFLVHEQVPWSVFESIGTQNSAVAQRVARLVPQGTRIDVKPSWYY